MKLFGYLILTGLLSLAPAVKAHATEDYDAVTYATQFLPVFVNGELAGCSLNFSAFKTDTIFYGGELVQVNGSVNLFSSSGREGKIDLFYALKIGVKRSGESSFTAPTSAWLVSEKLSNKADFIAASPAETDGFRLFKFNDGDATIEVMTQTITSDNTIRIAYSMNDGNMGSIVPISLPMKQLNLEQYSRSQVDASAPEKWLTCNVDAMQAVLSDGKTKRVQQP